MPFQAFETHTFDAEHQAKVDGLKKDFIQATDEINKLAHKLNKPILDKRDSIVATVDHFWPKAMVNFPSVSAYIDDEDLKVFDHLTSFKVDRDDADLRKVTLTFAFSDNDWFSDKQLSKTFRPRDDAPKSTAEYDVAEHGATDKVSISWKSEEKNLAKKNPSKVDDDVAFEPGSFFSTFFESDGTLALNIGENLANTFYDNAHAFFTGEMTGDMDDDEGDEFDQDDEDDLDDDEDDDDDDPNREIDLEEEESRPKKKNKKD